VFKADKHLKTHRFSITFDYPSLQHFKTYTDLVRCFCNLSPTMTASFTLHYSDTHILTVKLHTIADVFWCHPALRSHFNWSSSHQTMLTYCCRQWSTVLLSRDSTTAMHYSQTAVTKYWTRLSGSWMVLQLWQHDNTVQRPSTLASCLWMSNGKQCLLVYKPLHTLEVI